MPPGRKKGRVKLARSRDPLSLEIKKTLSSSLISRARTKFLLVVRKSESSYRSGYFYTADILAQFVERLAEKFFSQRRNVEKRFFENEMK